MPDAQVFEEGGAGIVILAERHDSAEDDVQSGASSVAEAVMAIPEVKVAVEEPMTLGGTLISNVGWGKPLTAGHTTARGDQANRDQPRGSLLRGVAGGRERSAGASFTRRRARDGARVRLSTARSLPAGVLDVVRRLR